VDKTEDIYRMVDEGIYYFLARPRRFGKSLLVSTLRCLFQGQRELFEGLWIADAAWDWAVHPVVLLDFNQIARDTPQSLETGLDDILVATARAHNITLQGRVLESRFREVLLELHQQSQQPVAVLIDEYDKPIIDHLGQGAEGMQIAQANRDLLKRLFGVLKGGDVTPILRFVLLTGVSRFSKVSVFSELNNLEDLTMSQRYATLLGYTQAELETNFAPHLARFAEAQDIAYAELLARMEHTYNGYRFSKRPVTVYNPFSTLRALREHNFGHYWFETGTPTFLIELLREQQYPLPQLERFQEDEIIFSTYDIQHLHPEALLFQTGYVTIKDTQGSLYTLGYPNQEVRQAFLRHLFYAEVTDATEAADAPEAPERAVRSHMLRLAGYLQQEDFGAFFETMQSIFASIPYTINTQRDEAYFHTLFYLMVAASGTNADPELLTSRGRIDLAVEFTDKVFVMEFKCNLATGHFFRSREASEK
jgi:predicted DNA-binding ribbon-helix-helix protein